MGTFQGKVVWFNNAKGFGFLAREDGPDIFCHFSAIEKERYKTLSEGEQVAFDVVQGKDGKPQAANVRSL
jgi:CspA family cold shock protein